MTMRQLEVTVPHDGGHGHAGALGRQRRTLRVQVREEAIGVSLPVHVFIDGNHIMECLAIPSAPSQRCGLVAPDAFQGATSLRVYLPELGPVRKRERKPHAV